MKTGFFADDPGYEPMTLLPLATRRSVMVDGPKVKFAAPEILRDLARAFTAPKRAMTGELDVNSPDGIQEAANLGLMALGSGQALTAGKKLPKGQLQILAGESARTSDLVALNKADKMQRAGAPREQIWKETGWALGPDGKWRFEIDDSQMFLQPGKLPYGHKLLFDAYPDLPKRTAFDITTLPEYSSAKSESGLFMPLTDKGDSLISLSVRKGDDYEQRMTDLILHELQHWIQNKEHFSPGGSPDEAKGYLAQVMSKKAAEKQAFDAYRKLRGEAEARVVSERSGLSAYERRMRPYWLDFDVPEHLQTENYQAVLPRLAPKPTVQGGSLTPPPRTK